MYLDALALLQISHLLIPDLQVLPEAPHHTGSHHLPSCYDVSIRFIASVQSKQQDPRSQTLQSLGLDGLVSVAQNLLAG